MPSSRVRRVSWRALRWMDLSKIWWSWWRCPYIPLYRSDTQCYWSDISQCHSSGVFWPLCNSSTPRPSPPAQHQWHRPGQVQESSDGSLRHQRRRKDPEERAGSLPRPQTQLTDHTTFTHLSFFPLSFFPSSFSLCTVLNYFIFQFKCVSFTILFYSRLNHYFSLPILAVSL